jgi:hypothetical protein
VPSATRCRSFPRSGLEDIGRHVITRRPERKPGARYLLLLHWYCPPRHYMEARSNACVVSPETRGSVSLALLPASSSSVSRFIPSSLVSTGITRDMA